MANFVFVAGTFHGGWYWDPIVPALLAAGHTVYTPTMPGLESDAKPNTAINLDTHIVYVLRLIEEHALSNIILVGWSYGGMVITGVADKVPSKIQKLIYLDGQVPTPGQREWDIILPADRDAMLAETRDGLHAFPDDGLLAYEPRMQPHPLGTKLQPITYDQARFDELDKLYVFAEEWLHNPAYPSPLRRHFERVADEPGWRVLSWPFGHDLVREASAKVTSLFLSEADA